jgi:ATP-dependent Lon protease
MFAVALLRHGATQPQPVATVGVIRACLEQPDGTANLVLEGVARVALVEYVQQQPYCIARIRRLPSTGADDPHARAPLLDAVKQFAKARSRLGSKLPKGMLSALKAMQSPDQLSDLISYTLLEKSRDKQLMLETLDVRQRLEKLVNLLQAQTRQFELWKMLQGKLTNDDVGIN